MSVMTDGSQNNQTETGDGHDHIPVICTSCMQFSLIFMFHYPFFAFTVNPLLFSHWFGLVNTAVKLCNYDRGERPERGLTYTDSTNVDNLCL